MAEKSHIPRLEDIVTAIDRIRQVTAGIDAATFEDDWQKQWLVERGVLIISEASRHLPKHMLARHPEIPWQEIAGIGSVLRHGYHVVRPDILWKVVSHDLTPLEQVCEAELERERRRRFTRRVGPVRSAADPGKRDR